jgi:hypothetical protein
MLFPLPEPGFFGLDLLGEAFAESLLFFFELGVVWLLDTSLSEFASLHLLETIILVVRILGGVDEIQHVRADQERTKFTEVAMVLVFN